jgi:hypothetical protein
MMRQEQVAYRYELYLPRQLRKEPQLNITWREKICQWSYNVVDHFELPRELVAISLNLFDRYMATRGNVCTGNMALLASLTTLHIAIKVHADKRIKISTLASLSRGQFGTRHIEEMEWQILSAIGWKLHPPTLFVFISHFLMVLPPEASHSVRKELFELSIYMAELSVCDSYFVKFDASTVAYAAIVNVLEEMPYSRVSAGIRETFLRDLAHHVGLNCRSPTVLAARDRLKAMFVPVIAESADSGMRRGTSPNPMEVEAASITSNGSGAGSGRFYASNRSLTSSTDSKGSCRYSPSPRRRCVVVSSPMTSSRGARLASSPITAGIQ